MAPAVAYLLLALALSAPRVLPAQELERAALTAGERFDFTAPRRPTVYVRNATLHPAPPPVNGRRECSLLPFTGGGAGWRVSQRSPAFEGVKGARLHKGFFRRAFEWAAGLVKIPVFGAYAMAKNLARVPGHMAAGLKRGDAGALLDPLRGLLDAGWNAATLAAAEANQALSPLFPGQSGEVRFSDGMLWVSGGPAGAIMHGLAKPRWRYFMPSQALVLGDRRQIACDCNPANPGDPYDNNAVNALHEVILQERHPVGYLTGYGLPWVFDKTFRAREEEAALQEAIRRLYGLPSHPAI